MKRSYLFNGVDNFGERVVLKTDFGLELYCTGPVYYNDGTN